MGKIDLTLDTPENFAAAVAAVKQGADECAKLSDLQFVYMTDHKLLTPDVTATGYANGTEIVVNHGKVPFRHRNREIPSESRMRYD